MANDKVFNTVELFFNGLLPSEEDLRRLRYVPYPGTSLSPGAPMP